MDYFIDFLKYVAGFAVILGISLLALHFFLTGVF
jgi:hypothetical protein